MSKIPDDVARVQNDPNATEPAKLQASLEVMVALHGQGYFANTKNAFTSAELDRVANNLTYLGYAVNRVGNEITIRGSRRST